jgi:hypothetical protein
MRIGLWGVLVVAAATAGAAVAGSGCSDDAADTETKSAVDAGPDGYVVQDGGGEPAESPEGESLCPEGICNYQTGEGCTAEAPGCIVQLDAMLQPVPACTATVGTGESGDACTAQDECAPGYLCAEGQCRKLCCGGDWSACPSEGEHCFKRLSVKGADGAVVDTGAMLCYPVGTCDLLDPVDSCLADGEACQIVDASGASACLPPGAGEQGDPCPCKGGYLCADLGDEQVCRKLCKAVEGGGDPYCADGEACIHYNSKHPADVGECVPLE